MFALEDSLRLPIGTRNIPADRTLLAGIASIDILNSYSSGFGLISKELFKLEEIPFIQVLTLFFAKSCRLPDSSQLLKCDYGSWIKRFYDSLCNHMVNIGSEAVLLLGYFTKVSFCRFTATGLQSFSDFLVMLGNSFTLTAIKELIFRGNGNLLNSSVNTNNFAGNLRISNVLAENYIQKNLILSNKQISGTSFPCKILLKIFRDRDRDFDSSLDSKQRKFVSFKPNIETSSIITDRTLLALWAGRFLLLFQSCFNGFNGFSSFHPGGYCKLGGKIFSRREIGLIMQRNPIRITIIPTYLANKVKCFCVSVKGWLNNFYRNIKFKFYGSNKFHIHIVILLNALVKKNLFEKGGRHSFAS